MGNAIKFTERGEVVVLVENAGEQLPQGEVCLRFVVTDTGIGIRPTSKRRFSGRSSRKIRQPRRRYGGTGLGLTIARGWWDC